MDNKDNSADVIFGLASLVIVAGALTYSFYVHQKEASKRKLIDIQSKTFNEIRKSAAYESATPKERMQILDTFQKAIKDI